MEKSEQLEEAIMNKYGETSAPNTYSMGKNTIDGIFVSNNMRIERGGYIDEVFCPGDHHFLWVDISKEIMIGESLEKQISPLTSKVTSKIPSIRKKFNEELYKQVQRYKLKDKTLLLKLRCEDEMKERGKISTRLSNILESIYTRMKRAIKHADKKCCKARRGKVFFSEETKKLSGRILVLKVIKKRVLLKGKPNRPRSKQLKRMAKKFHYLGDYKLDDIKQINLLLYEAHKQYNKLKPKASKLREEYLAKLSMELEEEDGIQAASHFKNLKHREMTK